VVEIEPRLCAEKVSIFLSQVVVFGRRLRTSNDPKKKPEEKHNNQPPTFLELREASVMAISVYICALASSVDQTLTLAV
jgi:hypothetical protein